MAKRRKRRIRRKPKAATSGRIGYQGDSEFKSSKRRRNLIGFTERQTRIINRLRRMGRIVGYKISAFELRQHKKEYGWKSTREGIVKAIRYKAGLAYTEYVDYLINLIEINNITTEFPRTYATLRNSAYRYNFTFGSLVQVHDIIYDFLNGRMSASSADAKGKEILDDGVKQGRQINDILKTR